MWARGVWVCVYVFVCLFVCLYLFVCLFCLYACVRCRCHNMVFSCSTLSGGYVWVLCVFMCVGGCVGVRVFFFVLCALGADVQHDDYHLCRAI